jgi:8-oxo-dGTP diphosphatase
MLYRNKKANDINEGKWIGLGGKFEPGESPEECLIREIREEAGVTLTEYAFRGILTFDVTDGSSEPMYLFVYTAGKYEGKLTEDCNEGTLEWVENEKITALGLWEGDKMLWDWLLNSDKFFSAKFVYDGDTLVEHGVAFY